MSKRKFLIFVALVLALTTLCWGVVMVSAEDRENRRKDRDDRRDSDRPGPIAAPSLQSGKNATADYYQRHREQLEILQENVRARGSNEVVPQGPTGRVTAPYPPSIVNPAVVANPLFPAGIGFNPGVDYTLPNFAQSPSIRKFVDSLPGLGLQGCTPGTGTIPNITGGSCNQNNLGQFIPIATPNVLSYPGNSVYPASDYYELGVANYTRQMHRDLPPTALRGYYVKGDPATDPTLLTPGTPQYLGPAILARTYNPAKPAQHGALTPTFPLAAPVNGKPVRLLFENHLPTSAGGADALPFPVDETIMGSGQGPLDLTGASCDYGQAACAKFTQNRVAIHLHGGHTPGFSDGTPHQWWTPAGDPIPGDVRTGYPWGMKKGPAFQNVPDMVNGSVVNGISVPCVGGGKCFTPNGNDGKGTFYYTNQQSPRLLFFHDHAWGITRLNVYAGTAAPYLIVDQVEDDLIDGSNVSGVFTAAAISPTQILPNLGGVYRYGIPLVIQDKTFVSDATTDSIRAAYASEVPALRPFPANYLSNPLTADLLVDPLWKDYTNGGLGMPGGSLWVPHEYMPVENIFDPRGFTDTGRWDYGAFMIPPMIPKYLTLPSPSITPEAFNDTMVVNGTAFPYVNLPPDAIRFRILNAGNDRSLNLQLYSAAVRPALVTFPSAVCTTLPIASTIVRGGVITGLSVLSPGAGCTSIPTVTITDVAGNTPTLAANVTANINPAGELTGFNIVAPNFGGTGYLAGTICKGQGALPVAVSGAGYTWPDLCTEVAMVPATPNANYPTWPLDGRDGGVPDPTTQGPPWLQIGNEAGFLAQLAVWPMQPVTYERIRQNLPFAGVTMRTLYLMGAMRADVVVDFNAAGYAAGDVVILYNDAPAPMPFFQTLYDYYTDSPDLSPVGALPTPAGFGPNTRTVMQIRITGTHTSPLNFTVAATPGFDESATGAFLPAIISGVTPGGSFDNLQKVLPKAFAAIQEKPIVPQQAYNAAFPGFATTDVYGQGYMETINISGTAKPVSRMITVLPGAGYTVAPDVTVVPGPGLCTDLPAGTAGLNPIGAVSLLTAGTGFTSPPNVTLGPPLAGGVQALAQATIAGGVVTGIVITEPGSNYDVAVLAVAPTCVIAGGGGNGATCSVALATAGIVGSITVTHAGACADQPLIFLTNNTILPGGGAGTGATAIAQLQGSFAPTDKAMTEGFDPDFARIFIQLGSLPNPLTPTVGAGPVIGIAKYIDPPTELLNHDETVLWRITHLGVDSHVMHFHLFDLQVVNRVDWANTVKQPFPDELGWRESIRTNPFEDIFIALKPTKTVLPFPEPQNIRPLDPSTPVGSTTNFLPILPPVGVPAVAQTTNTLTNFGFEYVWHCHILAHEENDMMRPTVFGVAPVPTASAPSVAWNPTLNKYHVAFRRADNRVYVGTANVDGTLNFDFAPLSTGTTAFAPAITYDSTHNKLIVAWKGTVNTNLYVGSLNPNGTGWSGTTPFGAGTTDSPAIAWDPSAGGTLRYAIRASSNTIWVGSVNFNGTTFSGLSQTQFSTTTVSSAPAIAIASTGPFAGRIQLAARRSDNRVVVGNILLPATFSNWQTLSTYQTSAAPGIAWNSITNKLDVVWKSNTGTSVFKAGIDGNSTGGLVTSLQVSGALSTTGPAAGINSSPTNVLPNSLNFFTLNAGNVSGYATAGL